MATFTTRMGLIKPAGNEQRDNDPLNADFDAIDRFMPCILVNDGVTPPTGDLYDGALVKERNSGILWEARKNGGGTFDKVYIRYPWHFSGYTGSSSIASSTSFAEWGVSTWEAGKNSSQSNIVSNRLVFPIKGIYILVWRYRWAGNGTATRASRILVNGVSAGYNDRTEVSANAPSGTAYTGMNMHLNGVFNANDNISAENWQNSGGGLDLFTYVLATLIDPVQ